MSADISGVSRSGRVRKKSAKLIEMEEMEKTDVNGVGNKNSRNSSIHNQLITSPLSNGSASEFVSIKKKIKIRFSTDNGTGVEEMPIDNSFDERSLAIENNTPTVPSLKIKLFQNSHDNFVTSPTPKISSKLNYTKTKDSGLLRARYTDDSAANLLFQQITSGQSLSELKRKAKQKYPSDLYENVSYGSGEEDEDDSDDETSLMICDSSESLAAAVEKVKAAKNPIKPVIDLVEDRKLITKKTTDYLLSKKDKQKNRPPAMTAYTLFCRENRQRILQSNPNLDFASISKRLGEVWQALPAREKMQWKRRAQTAKASATSQLATIAANTIRKPSQINIARTKPISAETSVYHFPRTPKLLTADQLKNCLTTEPKEFDLQPIDTACCFRIIGESLCLIGNKLNEPTVKTSQKETLDTLLDATICSLSSLLTLTNLCEVTNECDRKLHKQLLDNIAHIMPGVQ